MIIKSLVQTHGQDGSVHVFEYLIGAIHCSVTEPLPLYAQWLYCLHTSAMHEPDSCHSVMNDFLHGPPVTAAGHAPCGIVASRCFAAGPTAELVFPESAE